MGWNRWGSRRRRDLTKHLLQDRKPKAVMPKFLPGDRVKTPNGEGIVQKGRFTKNRSGVEYLISISGEEIWYNQNNLRLLTKAPD